jgi:hypothetical protein
MLMYLIKIGPGMIDKQFQWFHHSLFLVQMFLFVFQKNIRVLSTRKIERQAVICLICFLSLFELKVSTLVSYYGHRMVQERLENKLQQMPIQEIPINV